MYRLAVTLSSEPAAHTEPQGWSWSEAVTRAIRRLLGGLKHSATRYSRKRGNRTQSAQAAPYGRL